MQPCPYCGHPNPEVVLMQSGPHYAALVCSACHRQIRWLPRPETLGAPLSDEARAKIGMRRKAARLRGTPEQVGWAKQIRKVKVFAARKAKERPNFDARLIFDVLLAVNDASWFIMNRERSITQLIWPAVGQIAEPEAEPKSTEGNP